MAESKNDKINKLQLDINQVARAKSVLNQNQIQKIFNATPKRYVRDRPAKGGGEWSYVSVGYVRKVLDAVFGFRWDVETTTSMSEIQETIKMGFKQIVLQVRLTGWVLVDGEWIPVVKTATGRADIKYRKGSDTPLDFGNDIKAAESDALKKAASKFGIASDIYEADEFMEIEIIGSDENSDRKKAAKKKIEESKKVLKSGSTEVGGQNE